MTIDYIVTIYIVSKLTIAFYKESIMFTARKLYCKFKTVYKF